ncbi:GGDEF domain-containing protein [Pseudoalteromonas umbrosa]|uniref:GGDEF domain-containing protein n=1 Tax=Pseudoalteromonas umbrosa TaxID=3048489 RepID=UPI0024C45FE1|nr:GGDEF domain-containing protein [Pseudoalteromonas sp. B95]MDK1290386.1 GGDEF domain-containing protein [Pseudoalteromonas sp. B95]
MATRQHYFSQPDSVEQVKIRLFKQLAYYCLGLHCLLLVLFWYCDILILALVNIGSVIAWSLGIKLLHQNKSHLALRLFCMEVTLHSIFVCATLGMDYGFQYYLWTIASLILLDYQLKLKIASAMALSLIVTFALLFELFSNVDHRFLFSELAPFIHFINVLICAIPSIYTIGHIREVTFSNRYQLAQLAAKDPLTSLFNRRYAKELINNAQENCINTSQQLTIIMADIDHFKNINDKFGHDIGDDVLIEVALKINKYTQESDIAVRWGGEEFLLVLVNCDLHHAQERVECLRRDIAQHIFHNHELQVTMSFGIAQWYPALPFRIAVKLADDALYMSKAQGRNRTTSAPLKAV